MDECKHMHVQSWTFQDGESARFWSCSACGHKFVPLDLAQERDAKRYRWLRDSDWYIGPAPEGDTEGVSWDDRNDGELDDSIDAVTRKGDTHG